MVRSRSKVSAKLDELKREASTLPIAERAELALALIQSLDDGAEVEAVEEAWRLEGERRLRQVERGEVRPIPGDEVFARLRRQLG
jgi:putative addiction module component (TIGR02574 family)